MLQFDIPDQKVTTVAFRPDGRQLAVAGTDQRLDRFDLPGGGQVTTRIQRGGDHTPQHAAYILGGTHLVLLSGKGPFVFVDATSWREQLTWHMRVTAPAAGAVAPDGTSGLVAGRHGLRAARFVRPNPKAQFPDPFRDWFDQRPGAGLVYRAVAYHPAGKKLLVARSAADGSKARLDWLNLTTKLFAPAAPTPFPAERIACAPDGGRFAVTNDRHVVVWDAKANALAGGMVLRPSAAARCLAWHPGGRFLAVGGRDGVVRFLSADDLSEAAAYRFGAGPVRAVAFSPDGLVAAAGTARGRVVVWDVDA